MVRSPGDVLQPVVLGPPDPQTPVGRGFQEIATWINPCFAMVSPREAGWVWQHVETEVVGVAGEEDGVEKGELESPLFGNF